MQEGEEFVLPVMSTDKPAILERLVNQLKAKGHDKSSAYPIAISALQKSGNLKKRSTKPTSKGVKRGKMTPRQRELDRKQNRKKNYARGSGNGRSIYKKA